MPKDILALGDLPMAETGMLLQEAQDYRDKAVYPDLSGKIACNLFFEPSARTQYSFCAAQEKLRMRVISLAPEGPSLKKGWRFFDTAKACDASAADAPAVCRKFGRPHVPMAAAIMHPAPANRGPETAGGALAYGKPRIFRQAENGVYVRIAAIRRAAMGQ